MRMKPALKNSGATSSPVSFFETARNERPTSPQPVAFENSTLTGSTNINQHTPPCLPSEVREKVSALRNIQNSNWNNVVKNVVVILSSPRSGSSLLHKLLSMHPCVAALDGEIEPLLSLTSNGFGYNSTSDVIDQIANEHALINNIIDGLTTSCEYLPNFTTLCRRWEKRLLLQFPEMFSTPDGYETLLERLRISMQDIINIGIRNEELSQRQVLQQLFGASGELIEFYDGFARLNTKHLFNKLKLEEPPFITPAIYRRELTLADMQTKTLLFKTTADAYRVGLYGQLFPNAKIRFIHLTRGYAQTTNGLIDGWLSRTGFFSHNMKSAGVQLQIDGYSNVVEFGGDWWKFELPPNWFEFISAPLERVCLNQWVSAHNAILQSNVSTIRIAFEDLCNIPTNTVQKITDYLELEPMAVLSLPVVMAINTPKPRRWLKRATQLIRLGKLPHIEKTMNELGYKMDPETWL